jgi:hypothetical protein
MGLQVIGAGVGRTGTTSLKLALERLLGGRCYHMWEVFQQPSHVAWWQQAVDGGRLDWDAVFGGFTASVDWPAAAFWPELTARYPDAIVLLSERESADAWFDSVDGTISELFRRPSGPELAEWFAMAHALLRARFVDAPFERDAARRAYEEHNRRVRATVPPERLVVWRPGDGWGPLCAGLGLAEPGEPFPHLNTRDDYRLVLDRASEST